MKLLPVLTVVAVFAGLCAGCTSMMGFGSGGRSAGQENPGEFTLKPGYYTVWTEIPAGSGDVIFWFGKTDPRLAYITINKIYANNSESEDGAFVLVDFSANPFETPDTTYWWANFEKNVSGGKYMCGATSGEKWGGGFNHRQIRDYKYIGFSIWLDKVSFARIGDSLAEINGTSIRFIDMVKPLLAQ